MPFSSWFLGQPHLRRARFIRLGAALSFLAGLAVAAGAAHQPQPEQTLFGFDNNSESARISAADATFLFTTGPGGPALRIATGHVQKWPGVTLKAPADPWDLSGFDQVAMEVKNAGSHPVTVYCRVDNAGADGVNHCVTESLRIEPGKAGTLTARLKRTGDSKLGGKLFGMRGYPVEPGGPGTVDPAKIQQLLIFVSEPRNEHTFEISRVRASGRYVPPTAWVADADPFFPFIDTFGQYKHKAWPGKTLSEAGLAQQHSEELKGLAAHPGPANWNRYGGWTAGPQLEATGFFRTEKHQGKWWLIDPEGRLFFSQGIDCVRMREFTPVDERESWFEDFPGNQAAFQNLIIPGAFALKGHYAGRSPRSFSFAAANLVRKYGAEGARAYPELIHTRLRSWGLNTIGMWSDPGTFLLRRTAYVDSIGSHGVRMIEGSEGYWGKFPDVWDSGYRERLRKAMAGKAGKSAGDPWCIGYFADNEMSWGEETSLAVAALQSPPDQAAKRAFVADLREAHGSIEKLNAAWGASHASWDALLQSTRAPDPKKAHADLVAFYTRTAEMYFRTVREVIKEQAPNQLYLGCRFAWVNARAAAAAARYCDVVSYNLYSRGVADFQFNGGADVPLIIGEFHFGALDRGMFHTGLVPVRDQAARAQAYTDYVEGALRHPAFVGCHWFQYQDEPTTGRVYDEENYQIGFVDIADTPYRETVEACRALAAKMYRIRLEQ